MGVDLRQLEELAAWYERAAESVRRTIQFIRDGQSLLGTNGTPTSPPLTESPSRKRGRKQRTRQRQLADWLAQNGPATRAEIIERSGLPPNTARVLLTKANFRRGDDGRWTVKEDGS